jgi:hypothetical protein
MEKLEKKTEKKKKKKKRRKKTQKRAPRDRFGLGWKPACGPGSPCPKWYFPPSLPPADRWDPPVSISFLWPNFTPMTANLPD